MSDKTPQCGVIWDLGGTLIDTYPQVDQTLADGVRAHGHEVALAEVVSLTRRSIATAITDLTERFDLPAGELKQAYAELKQQWKQTPPPVMEGAFEVLDAVRRLGGLNLVVTHRERESASALLNDTGLEVDDLVCVSDGFPRKPDSTMYRVVTARHGIPPQRCLAVGDREIDIQAALALNMRAALLETPGIPINLAGCAHITSLREVLGLLMK